MQNNRLSDVNSKSGSELIAIAHGIAANFESPATELLSELASRLECSIIRGNELQQKLDAANEKLSRYSMPAGQTDQFAAEAKSVRVALGFSEDAQDVAPVDLLKKISGLRAEGVVSFIEKSPYVIPHRLEAALSNYAEQLRSGTHDTADKAGAK